LVTARHSPPDYRFVDVVRILIFALHVSEALFGHLLFRDQKGALDAFFLINSGWGAQAITRFQTAVRLDSLNAVLTL